MIFVLSVHSPRNERLAPPSLHYHHLQHNERTCSWLLCSPRENFLHQTQISSLLLLKILQCWHPWWAKNHQTQSRSQAGGHHRLPRATLQAGGTQAEEGWASCVTEDVPATQQKAVKEPTLDCMPDASSHHFRSPSSSIGMKLSDSLTQGE